MRAAGRALSRSACGAGTTWGHGIRFRDTQPTARPAFADTRPADGLASSGWLMSSMELVNGVEIVDSEGDDWAITQQGHLHDGSHCARDGVDPASTITVAKPRGNEPSAPMKACRCSPTRTTTTMPCHCAQAYRQLEIELETARRCHPHLNARVEELSGELAALARRIAWLSDDAPDRDT